MAADTASNATLRKVIIASLAGTVLEFYDFFLYGFTAALVFGKVFFPTYAPLTATLASFGTLAVGFVARPLGGMICGHFGDRLGRKATLIVTLGLMGGATFLIGLLPTYETIGIAAPILLIVLRFLQGIGLGGEWGGAVLMTLEHSPATRRGFYGSMVQIGAPLGLALATLVLLIGSLLPGNAFIEWGWRIPFLASAILLFIGLYIRARISETPEFKRARDKGDIVAVPFFYVVRNYPKQVLSTAGLYLGAITVPFYTVWVFLVYYVTAHLHVDRSATLTGVVIANFILVFGTILGGIVSDRIGQRATFVMGASVLVALAFPLFWVVDMKDPWIIGVAMLAFGGTSWFMWGGLAALVAEQFPAGVRYTGMSVGSQSATIIGGFVPMFATALFPIAGTWPVSVLVIACAFITIHSAVFATQAYKRRAEVPAAA